MTEPDNGTGQRDLGPLLERLHHELSTNPPTDARSQQLLLELKRDIERATVPAGDSNAAAGPTDEPLDLRQRVQETIAGFEGAYPESAAALERVLVLLSNFGL